MSLLLTLDRRRPPFAAHYRRRIICTMGSGDIAWLPLPEPTNQNGKRFR